MTNFILTKKIIFRQVKNKQKRTVAPSPALSQRY